MKPSEALIEHRGEQVSVVEGPAPVAAAPLLTPPPAPRRPLSGQRRKRYLPKCLAGCPVKLPLFGQSSCPEECVYRGGR